MDAAPQTDLPAISGPGGKGEEPRRKEAVQLCADLREAAVYQAPLSEAFVKRVRDVCRALMASPKGRQRAAGARLSIRLMEYNLALFEKADKMDRLERGAPTERVEHTGDGQVDLREASRRDPAILAALIRLEERREREEDEAESRGNGGA